MRAISITIEGPLAQIERWLVWGEFRREWECLIIDLCFNKENIALFEQQKRLIKEWNTISEMDTYRAFSLDSWVSRKNLDSKNHKQQQQQQQAAGISDGWMVEKGRVLIFGGS